MLPRTLAFLSLVFALLFYSCSPQNSQVIAKFGDQEIGLKEFEKAYKNNEVGAEKTSKDSLSRMKDYLNLYVNFRMKLRDAYVRGYDQDSSLQSEIQDYKKKIGATYIINTRLIEPGVRKLYERRKTEYRISIILISPKPQGWNAAETKANKILDSLKSGADWDSMAKKYSEDKYSASEGGDLFYFTAGELPYQLEDAMYDTQPGQIYPEPVKISIGYVILKVTDRRERRPEIRVSHIMIAFDKNGKRDTTGTWEKIDTVMQKLKAGGNFAKLAEEYSQDSGSSKNGGDLGYMDIRRLVRVKPFAEAAFNLKKVGDISGIVKSQFGYHIIKLTDVRPLPKFGEDEQKLKDLYQKTRYNADYDLFVDSLKKKYDYKLNNAVLNEVIKATDTLNINQADPKLAELKTDTLFTYADAAYTVGEFTDYMHKDKDIGQAKLSGGPIDKALQKAGGDIMIEKDAEGLDKTDPAFADLMKDYKDGVYIFKLQQDEVWNKINADSADLYKYYLANKDKYLTKPKVSFSEIFSRNDSLINALYARINNGENFETLAAKYTERPGFKVKKGIWESVDTTSELARAAYDLKSDGEITKPVKYEGGYSIIKLLKKEPSRPETFEEAKQEVAGAYQDFKSKELEQDYLKKLDKIYKPKIYYNKLEEAFKNN